jgi:hypothetical protein
VRRIVVKMEEVPLLTYKERRNPRTTCPRSQQKGGEKYKGEKSTKSLPAYSYTIHPLI